MLGADIPVIEISEFSQPTILKDPLLRERALQSKMVRSRQFIARLDGAEVGYLSFDDRPDIGVGVLYDLLVLTRFRRGGIGSALIAEGESLVRALGYKRVRVSPRAFDGSVDQGWLESWYRNHGYNLASDGSQEYEKQLGLE